MNTQHRLKISLISIFNPHQMSLRPIHALLRSEGYPVQLIFLKNYAVNHFQDPDDWEIQALMGELKNFNPDLVGICVTSSMTFRLAVRITHMIHAGLDCPVIWGGVHPSIRPEQSVQIADIVCRMQGEMPILELARAMETGGDYSTIQNLWVRSGDRVTRNPVRPPMTNLNGLPYPDWGDDGKLLIDNRKVIYGDPHRNGSWQYFTFLRKGCPYACSYCVNSIYHSLMPEFVRQEKSIEYMMGELEHTLASCPGVGQIMFVDEVFITDPDQLDRFMLEYTERIGLPYFVLYRPEHLSPRITRTLKQTGIDILNVGLQSGCEHTRRALFNRDETDDEIRRGVAAALEEKLPLRLDIIMDNPYESEADRRQALEFLLSLPKPFEVTCLSLTYLPETPLTLKALADGIITQEQVEDNARKGYRQWSVTFDYPRSRMQTLWISLTSLTGKPWVPNRWIRSWSHNRFLQRHPGVLRPLIRTCSWIQLFLRAARVFRAGKLTGPLFRMVYRKRAYFLGSVK